MPQTDHTTSRSRSIARQLASLLGAICAALSVVPAIAAEPAPVADFFKLPDFSDVLVSPSGKRVSAIVPGPNGRKRLAVLAMDDPTNAKIVASYSNADVRNVEWVNDERLVFRIFDQSEAVGVERGLGLFSVEAQGGAPPRMLIAPQYNMTSEITHIKSRLLQPDHVLYSVLRDGSGTDDVIVQHVIFDPTGQVASTSLLRLDTKTGISRGISQGAPEGADEWALDRQGNPRAVVTISRGKEAVHWKAAVAADWVKVEEVDALSDRRTITPGFVDVRNRLFASARVAPYPDTSSLVTIDMAGGIGTAQPVFSAEGYDVGDGTLLLNSSGAVLGVRYLTDAHATYWFDAGMKKIQDQVDALLPGTSNRLDCGDCDNRARVLVASWSDRQPVFYQVFDTATGKLMPLVQSRPWINAKAMALQDMYRFKARDGLEVPVYVTRPAGLKGALPAVVLVHGGPWVRGPEWGWESQRQFLASRGYAVIEPEFRGSTGFGWKHFKASWKQWGLAMQDDVADAALWAVKQGHADPKRICVAGASYGGYATLMGLIRNPEIFRCGVEWVGVTDINLMYSISWSDSDDLLKQYEMPRRIGDPVKDAAQLAATSPIRLADKLTQPLLMAYGGRDRRVPIDHGIQFRDAVRKTNKNVEWIVYADEAHGWTIEANNVDFWTRVERFLDKNLKNAP